MPKLTAVVGGPGPEFVAALRAAWDRGDAIAPIDPRLPPPARAAVLAALRPGEVLDEHGRRAWPGGEDIEAGDALVVATSGTTGAPKGVVLTHDAVRASAYATSEALGVDAGRDGWLCCLPVSHMGGLSVITRALLTGTPLVLLPGFDPEAVAAAGRDGPATLTSLVATTLARLGPDAAAFRRILLGGSAPPADLPANVVTTYGLTETGSGLVYDGRPLAGAEVRIEAGEILVRGPMLFRGYRDGTDPRDPEGWLATGDAGQIGADGRLAVFGRLGDLIITGGENVWPSAVEETLLRHPSVAEAAVTGVEDPEWGERVVAYVVAERNGPAPTLDQLRAWVKEHLAPWAAPRQLVVVDRLPRTAIGKIRRGALPDPKQDRSGAG